MSMKTSIISQWPIEGYSNSIYARLGPREPSDANVRLDIALKLYTRCSKHNAGLRINAEVGANERRIRCNLGYILDLCRLELRTVHLNRDESELNEPR